MNFMDGSALEQGKRPKDIENKYISKGTSEHWSEHLVDAQSF